MSIYEFKILVFEQGFHTPFSPAKPAQKQAENGLFLGRKFAGKELDEETGYGYFGARCMDHELMTGWLSVDPMADKYPNISPYVYCAWNPIKLVDPDGRDVLPTSEEAYQMILMTIPEVARDFVQCGENGCIDRDLINSFDCESSNFRDLQQLVNNDCVIEVSVSSSYDYIGKDGNVCTNNEFNLYQLATYDDMTDLLGVTSNLLSTGETGCTGITQYPEASAIYPSTNEHVKVHVNSQLSAQGRAETFAHEFYGHAFIYATTSDVEASSHHYETGSIDRNELLQKRIINAKRKTIMNNK